MEDSGGVSVADLVSRSAAEAQSTPARPRVVERPPESPQAPSTARQTPARRRQAPGSRRQTPTGGRQGPVGDRPTLRQQATTEWGLSSLPTQREASDFSLPGIAGSPPAAVTTTLSPQQLATPTRPPGPQQGAGAAPDAEPSAPQRHLERHVQPQREAHRAPPPEEIAPAELTDELEPINETTAHIRRVDETLRRFAAVHDEVAEEERRKGDTLGRLRGLFSRGDALAADGTQTDPDLAGEAREPDAEQVSHRHRTTESTRVLTRAVTGLAVLLVLAVVIVVIVVAT
jgi:hypothetical protein